MTPERFLSLIDSYGADPARWPQAWRAEADAVARSGDAVIVRALDDARSLDAELSRHLLRPVDAELVRRIMASGPTPRRWHGTGRHVRWWLSGVGLVSAGLGGVAAGALAISLIVPVSAVSTAATLDASDASVGTAFGEVGVDGGEQ